jgi:hypothetical protein
MAKIFLHDVRHSHAQCSRKILLRHRLLLHRVLKKADQTICEISSIPSFVKSDRQFLSFRHLPKVGQVRTNNGHTVSAGQMRDSAATCRRGIRHHSDGRSLEKIGQIVLVNVAREFNSRIPLPLFLQRFDITASVRMIPSSDNQPGIGYLLSNAVEGVDHQFQTFVSAPLAEGENSVLRISAPRKVRRLRPPRQNAMRPHMHIFAAIFFRQDLAIPRHEH